MFLKKTGSRQYYESDYRFLRDGEHTEGGKRRLMIRAGGFCCQHSHRDKYHIRALLEFLGVCNAEARHKPVIRVVRGELDRVVDAAEKELANRGRHYQAGGLIVSVSTDPSSGDPSIVPTSLQALTRELSVAATWEKYDGRAQDWARCDPPDHADYRLVPCFCVANSKEFKQRPNVVLVAVGVLAAKAAHRKLLVGLKIGRAGVQLVG